MWLPGLGAAILLKLTSSIDDVVWLAPFLTSNVSTASQMNNAIIYLSVCLMQTVVAMFLAYSGNSMVDFLLRGQKDAWSSDKILTVGAGSLLAIYAVKLTYDYFFEEEESDSKTGEAEKSDYDQVPSNEPEVEEGFSLCCANKSAAKPKRQIGRPLSEDATEPGEAAKEESMDAVGAAQAAKDSGNSKTLFVIAFIGSVDDLTVFVPMLVGKAFDLGQLMLGSLIAASVIVMLCVFLGLCKPIADCLAMVPLALIVAIFATTLLTKGFFME